jgi:hypothetical protein
MTDTLLLIGILAAWVIALTLMPRMQEKRTSPKFRALETGESGGYDPTKDPEKVMSGEIESYFD